MADENIFGGDPTTPPVQTPVQAPPADPFSPLLAEIKGDNGEPKYKDVNTALGALKHSQDYIKQLKDELEQVKAKAEQAVTMEQVLEQLKPKDPPADAPATPPAGLTAEDVIRILQQKEDKERAMGNTQIVARKFKEVYGDKAEEAFYSKAAEMGLSKEAINGLAASSPSAVFSMFGVKDSGGPAPSAPSGVNTSGMQVSTPQPLGSVMGFKTSTELVDYWTKLKTEVNKSLGVV